MDTIYSIYDDAEKIAEQGIELGDAYSLMCDIKILMNRLEKVLDNRYEFVRNFNWDSFANGNIAVNCKTKESARNFMMECRRHNIYWFGGTDPIEKYRLWNNFGSNTAYVVSKGGLAYSNIEYYEDMGKTITEWVC